MCKTLLPLVTLFIFGVGALGTPGSAPAPASAQDADVAPEAQQEPASPEQAETAKNTATAEVEAPPEEESSPAGKNPGEAVAEATPAPEATQPTPATPPKMEQTDQVTKLVVALLNVRSKIREVKPRLRYLSEARKSNPQLDEDWALMLARYKQLLAAEQAFNAKLQELVPTDELLGAEVARVSASWEKIGEKKVEKP